MIYTEKKIAPHQLRELPAKTGYNTPPIQSSRPTAGKSSQLVKQCAVQRSMVVS